ncbi:MAG: hypothetical protein QOJ03_2739 [Frankiaceae bacterium]|jgi:hypothetical protein|nr:hypothetical protein [Frankiaceae bacterium]
MFRLALRAAALVGGSAMVIGLSAVPSVAAGGSVSGLSPTFGPVGRVVDITGTGLASASDVTFGGVDAGAPTLVDDGHIRAAVPPSATSGLVRVTTTDGTLDGPSFTVQQPTSATIGRSRVAVTFPGAAVVRAVLRAAGIPVQGQPARLQHRSAGAGPWRAVQATHTTGSDGAVQWRVTPQASSDFRVVFRQVPTYLGSTTRAVRINVRPQLDTNIPRIAPILTPLHLRGRVHPRPAQHGRVFLDQRLNGSWQRVESAPIGRHGRFDLPLTLATTGRYYYRVRRPGSASYWSSTSAVTRIKAVKRTLRPGMSGHDVRTLQRRLRALHYDVGAVNGSYGFDTQHAVVAFEKIQEIQRDGVVGPKVWRRLASPKIPHLRHPESAGSAGVEVDLTHQVLYYAVNGHIWRILDSSTGGGYYYTGSDGTSQQAITPTGHFSVVYMREGWVTSKLGTLYRPAYFNNDGFAIHGEGEVPSYPASHGCVRITVPARDRLGSKLYNGLSVWIYGA